MKLPTPAPGWGDRLFSAVFCIIGCLFLSYSHESIGTTLMAAGFFAMAIQSGTHGVTDARESRESE